MQEGEDEEGITSGGISGDRKSRKSSTSRRKRKETKCRERKRRKRSNRRREEKRRDKRSHNRRSKLRKCKKRRNRRRKKGVVILGGGKRKGIAAGKGGKGREGIEREGELYLTLSSWCSKLQIKPSEPDHLFVTV